MPQVTRFIRIVPLLSLIALGCSGGGSSKKDAGADSGQDGGVATPKIDSGTKPDAGKKTDAGPKKTDGGTTTSACGSVAACPSPATCDRSAKTPTCVCPTGYRFNDTGSSSSSCVDVDECSDAKLNGCDAHATCTNNKGGFDCACNGPAYKGDGKTCACALGYTDVSGQCLANNAKECSADGDCTHGHCVSGICCASACDSAPGCRTTTGATCAGGLDCVYPALADDTVCDDANTCTTNDKCSSGSCVGTNQPTTFMCQADDMCATGYRCSANAVCTPATRVDCSAMNSTDGCKVGTCDLSNGSCMQVTKADGSSCNDSNACTVDETCSAGTCGSGATRNCDDSNPCTDDSCDNTAGCLYAANNTATCSDSDACTDGDHCSGKQCQGTPKDCSSQNDDCNVGTCSAGACGKSPRTNGTACNDSNSCTASEMCSGGSCTGTNACGAHATSCSPGSPNTCNCDTGYTDSNGTCVPLTNECAPGNSCSTAACAYLTCTDPSSTCGDRMCIDQCANNPCGAGTCVDGVGTHTCNCNPGFTSVNGVCVCDLNGTFAIRTDTTFAWSNVSFGAIEDASGVLTRTWAIRHQTYDSSGTLTVDTTSCGGTVPELCGTGTLSTYGIPAEAYAQFFSNQIWGAVGSLLPVPRVTTSMPDARPGRPFVEQPQAAVLGLTLTNNFGTWPGTRGEVGGTAPTNGAAWFDHDNDGQLAMTSYAVPPGGVSTGTSPYPPVDYGAMSTVCPRGGGTKLSYAYWPGLLYDTNTATYVPYRVKRFYTASRVISQLSGTITSCDASSALIQGPVIGPAAGQTQVDGRFRGCVRENPTGDLVHELDCNDAETDLFDTQPQSEQVTGASFIMKSASSSVTCADVRAMAFP